MPEGPEVEILMRHLAPRLEGRRVVGVPTIHPRLVRPESPATARRRLVGLQWSRLSRRGKNLCLEALDPGGRQRLVIVHLGMSGRLFTATCDPATSGQASLVMELDHGFLVFRDPRQFGRVHSDASVLDRVGPDPSSPAFTPEHLLERLHRTRRTIKVCLLDPGIAAGVGNIYACEALFRAGLPPQTPGCDLSAAQVRRLHQAIRDTLADAIELGLQLDLDFSGGGSGERLFYFGAATPDRSGSPGERFRVYGRAGEPCPECRTPILRIDVGGRGTFLCPACQGGGKDA